MLDELGIYPDDETILFVEQQLQEIIGYSDDQKVKVIGSSILSQLRPIENI